MSEREPLPTWVKASLVVVALAAAAVVLVLLLAGGEHGPGRHTSAPLDRPAVSWPSAVANVHANR